MTVLCGGARIPMTDDQADAIGPLFCCWGSGLAEGDPRFCTCWEPIYDLDQTTELAAAEPVTRLARCVDCAFRPESADQTDIYPEQADRDALLDVGADRPFWCHQGMRRLVAWQHPEGHRIVNVSHDYKPPEVDTVPYKADGTPADRCAGWARRTGQADLTHVWWWRKHRGDRKDDPCRVLARATGPGPRNVLVEFGDGEQLVAPMFAVRRLP